MTPPDPAAHAQTSPSAPAAGTPLVLVGGGGHALVVAEAAQMAGFRLAGFLDDDRSGRLGAAAPWLGRLEDASALAPHLAEGARWILAVGDLGLRARLLLGLFRHAAAAATVVHPEAFVSPTAVIGPGAWIGPRAVVHTRASVGPHAIINTGAIVEHECQIGENAHVAPGTILGGNVKIGPNTLIGVGSRVLPNLSVGQRGVVGAGAVVVRSVAPGSTVVGAPASPVGAAGGAGGGS